MIHLLCCKRKMDMSSNDIWYYFATGALALIITVFIVKRKRVKLPPGPFALPLLGHLHLLKPNLHECLSTLSNKYGPLMTLKLGMKTSIVVSSSAIAKEILKDNDQIFANRVVPVVARCLAYDGSDILWSPYGPKWRFLRKICVKELFSAKSMDALNPLRREEVGRTIGDIYKDSMNGISVDVGAKAFATSLNLITNMMWNKSGERVLEFRDLLAEELDVWSVPNFSDLFPFLERLDLQGLYRRMHKVFVKLDGLFDRIIDERVKGESEGNDFLKLLLDLVNKGVAEEDDMGSFQLTMRDVKALFLDMVGGSTETTSSTVEWAMAELLQNPEIMERAQEELKQVVGLDQRVEEHDISKLPLMEAIVKETLRLHPTVPLLVPHSPDKTCQISGYVIPKGAEIMINVWKIHRNPQVWKDPLVFDPERFMEDPCKWEYNGREFDYIPFGSGRRICAGIPMATGMVHFTLASFLHSFDWSLQCGEKLDMSEKFGFVMHKAVPLVAYPKPRLSQAQLY